MDDKEVMDSLGMQIKYPSMPIKQQPNLDARKLPSRNGIGNDMGMTPNAINGSRYIYCDNAHGEMVDAEVEAARKK